jgi:hypothetical protein
MRNILKYLPIALILLGACNPMEDIYKDLDEVKLPYAREIEYTLLSNDYKTVRDYLYKNIVKTGEDSSYADAIYSDLAFNQYFTSDDYIHAVLYANFPALEDNSSATVTYRTTVKDEALVAYESSVQYTVTSTDYSNSNEDVGKNGYFFPSEPADKYLPTILAAQLPEADSGQYAYVTYNQSGTDPIGSVVLLNEEFNDYEKYDTINKNGWMVYSEAGTKAWQGREFNSNRYAQASAYGAAGTEILYMITPAIDLSNSIENNLTFDVNVGYWTHIALSVLISDDLNGSDVENATWYDVTNSFTLPATGPADGYGAAFVNSGNLLLNDFTGTIHVAFRYTGDGATAQTTTYQIDNVLIKGVESGLKSVNAAEYEVYNDLYAYSGATWTKVSNMLVLDPADYELMGITRFSETSDPAVYLPQYLTLKFPIVLDNTSKLIIYEYSYDALTLIIAAEYIYNAGIWSSKSNGIIQEKSEQFVFSPDLQLWKPDPAIRYIMVKADYQLIVDYVVATFGESWLDDKGDGTKYTNSEHYYGSSAFYGNFDKNKWNTQGFETWEKCVQEAVQKGFLPSKYPEAVTQVKGVDVHYFITTDSYDKGTRAKYTLDFVCTKNGPEPEFEFVSIIKL